MFRINIYLIFLFCYVPYLVLNISCHPFNRFVYINNTKNIIYNRTKEVLILPIRNMTVTYVDNTTRYPDSVFSDSFFIETANSLIEFECKKYFSLNEDQRMLKEYDTTIVELKKFQYSHLYEITRDFNTISLRIKEIIHAFNVDYLIIPYSFEINHSSFQQKGWRNSPHYMRPVKHSVRTKTHFQIWNQEGVLVYERMSIKKSRRPFLYSFFENINKPDNIIKYSKSPFAPPALKSLFKAISSALNISKK